jgi:hypothetical protein
VPVVRAQPSICVVPLLVMLLIAAASSLGVVFASRADEHTRRLAAQGKRPMLAACVGPPALWFGL